MNPLEIIAAKRDGMELSSRQITALIEQVTAGNVPDYQTAAWLMAVYLRGMTLQETTALTLAMRDSGSVVQAAGLPNGPLLDKHSTGGVGDKTSLALVPMLAACGAPLLKMSGRGLGITGGTIDKLESIPGFRAGLALHEAVEQVRTVGAAMVAQSKELAPADGILYALRDVTGTVASMPLIAASIMSKKLASGADCIVLDVKAGSGAFMRTRTEARALARLMMQLGREAGTSVHALITDMNQPLGRTVGNALELEEALDVLENKPGLDARFRRLCIQLAGYALAVSNRAKTWRHGRELAENALASGAAAEKCAAIISAQGGPHSLAQVRATLPRAHVQKTAAARRSGYLTGMDAAEIGKIALELGAGRTRKNEPLNHAAGIKFWVGLGDYVQKGAALASVYGSSNEMEPQIERLADACTIEPHPQQPDFALLEVVRLKR